jgi:hypothetical protein
MAGKDCVAVAVDKRFGSGPQVRVRWMNGIASVQRQTINNITFSPSTMPDHYDTLLCNTYEDGNYSTSTCLDATSELDGGLCRSRRRRAIPVPRLANSSPLQIELLQVTQNVGFLLVPWPQLPVTSCINGVVVTMSNRWWLAYRL